MFCAQCGTANADQGQFCVKCGVTLQTAPGAMPPAPATIPAYPGPGQPYVGPTETSGKAIASLICAILFIVPFAGIAAVVLGHLSLSDIRKSAGRLTGRGVAIAGLALGYAGLSIIFVLIIAAIAIPNLLRARIAANEAVAVQSLRTINVVNATYASTYDNGFAPSLDALGGPVGDNTADCNHALLIGSALSSGQKSGYIFTYKALVTSDGSPADSRRVPGKGCTTAGAAGFTVTANPVQTGTAGHRSFYTDQSGTIRYSADGPATAESTPLE
jgi:type IV pilus assembly protein PilA